MGNFSRVISGRSRKLGFASGLSSRKSSQSIERRSSNGSAAADSAIEQNCEGDESRKTPTSAAGLSHTGFENEERNGSEENKQEEKKMSDEEFEVTKVHAVSFSRSTVGG
mmetsp:Transcript_7834/g.21769  ORF Transcript_7834/g.21769 Transcript_7834/m.21769 type:complete len:110 (-) Transcript_7834:58-387(-)